MNAPGLPPSVGQPVDRKDGRLKVTGGATYAAEHPLPGLAYGALVTSTIARGRVLTLDTGAAQRERGVLAVLTPHNAPGLTFPPPGVGAPGQSLLPLQDAVVHHHGQVIALVVADTLERAEQAASLVRATYAPERPVARLHDALDHTYPAPGGPLTGGQDPTKTRGDVEAGLRAADVRLDLNYTTQLEHHLALELPSATAAWGPAGLTVYEGTQAGFLMQATLAAMLGLPRGQVRVVSPFVGGAFGSRFFVWPHTVLAALAARAVGRPVRVTLTRRQAFSAVGFRPPTAQRLELGARRDGRLVAIRHAFVSQTSALDDFTVAYGEVTHATYACPNVQTRYALARVNQPTPTIKRAPPEAPSTLALESALDELAYALQLDPLELRRRNFAARNFSTDQPWSSNALRTCYQQGAERFGWSRRPLTPRSLRDGSALIGWGMATSTYPLASDVASAVVRLEPTGRAVVRSGAHDLGTGTYTTMAQVAADALGLSVTQVQVELGDTALNAGPAAGSSQTSASLGPAVQRAALHLRAQLLELAVTDPASPLAGLGVAQVALDAGQLFAVAAPGRHERVEALLARHGRALEGRWGELQARPGQDPQYVGSVESTYAFGAHFVEVRVDEALRTVRFARYVGVFDIGRVLNPKTARSQLIGGVTFGLGQALLEQTRPDPRSGRYTNASAAEYLVPVHADLPDLDVSFVGAPDPSLALGTKSAGELGTVGMAGAVANAVFHATGKRVRDFPISIEHLF